MAQNPLCVCGCAVQECEGYSHVGLRGFCRRPGTANQRDSRDLRRGGKGARSLYELSRSPSVGTIVRGRGEPLGLHHRGLSISVSAGTTHSASQIAARLQRPRSEGRKYPADLRCFTGSAKRPRHRPRERRQQAAGSPAGAARHSSTHDEDGKEIRVTTREMLEVDDED